MKTWTGLPILWGIALALTGCGPRDNPDDPGRSQASDASEDTTASDDATPAEDDDAMEDLQLKGVNLLGQSLFATLGPRKDLSGLTDTEGEPLSLLEIYAGVFGHTKGLRFGKVFADGPSTAYFLALAILADNAAAKCQEEQWIGGASYAGPCRCDTHDTAQAMLQRAIPFIDFEGQQDLVTEFALGCHGDYRATVASLVASISFAVKS